MSRIQVLDPKIASRIAAGEVVTRPAAVVKELVENALDAGARRVTVEIAEGGRRRLRVVDDGRGMTAEEVPLALMRHATSKIRQEEDLLSITTLGFRGEALPSIAQVSRLEVLTRAPGAPGGWRLTVEGGESRDSQRAPAPDGTQVTVEDLFYNTPVRRKFLKSRQAEQAYILETLRQLALGYPEVHFRLVAEKRTLLAAPAAQTLMERVAAVYSAEAAANLLPFALEGGPWAAAGALSVPDYTVASSRFQVLLVNRRVVQDRILAAAVKAAYQGLMPRGRHPVVVVYLTLPPEQVDVNVHPAKTEVRFRDPGKVYGLLLGALRQGLGSLAGEAPQYRVSWQPGSLALAQDPGAAPPPAAAPSAWSGPLPSPAPSFPSPPEAPSPPPRFRFQDLHLIGQLQNTYILAQSSEGLVLIDQHAAHERVLYEKLAAAADGSPRQSLLFPRVVEVSPAQADWVGENLELLADLGLGLEPFGGASFRVTAVPAWLAQADLEALVLDLVDNLAPVKSRLSPQGVQEQVRTLMACHGAIRAGQQLAPEEMMALLAQLDEIQVSSHCPHGRPLWRLIPYTDIRQSFRRPRG
ncbi:MAG: DNA mismatch repair endonuclease MutL [Thermodesulfobacteriota bacterium]